MKASNLFNAYFIIFGLKEQLPLKKFERGAPEASGRRWGPRRFGLHSLQTAAGTTNKLEWNLDSLKCT